MSSADLSNQSESNLPLLSKKILVTRAGSQGESFAAQLRELGAKPILMPMIEISSPDSWQELDQAIDNLDNYQWLLFASSNAVASFQKRFQAKANNKKKLPDIAVIGDTTAQAAHNFGMTVRYCPTNFLAEDFISQFPGYPDNLKEIKILWPRTNHGRDYIEKKLQAAGAVIDVISAYKTDLPKNAAELSKELVRLLKTKEIDVITLASKQTAINLAKIIAFEKLPEAEQSDTDLISRNSLSPVFVEKEVLARLKDTLQGILIVTIGPETSEGALNYLGKVDKEANQHSAEGMIDALIGYYK